MNINSVSKQSSKTLYRPLDASAYDSCESGASSNLSLNSDDALVAPHTPGATTLHPYRVARSNLHKSPLALKNASTRKFLAVGLLVSMLVCYLMWSSLAADKPATGYDQSYKDGIVASSRENETLKVCSEVYADTRQYIANKPRQEYDHLPVIYFITPTYARREQIAELTRLAHTLLHVPRLHWIVANDHDQCNAYLDELLKKFGMPYTHLASPMPDMYRKKKPTPRGVSNRRAALKWLRTRNITRGVLYFGDDDNTYDLRLFAEIRDTVRVSMFPVSLIGNSISSPVVRGGKVVGFLDEWVADRHWPVDMAGFAVNLAYMAEHPKAGMPYKSGYEEDFFLRSVGLKLDLIEPKGSNCTEILVWHTQTKNHPLGTVRIGHEYLDDRSNLGALFRSLGTMGVVTASDSEGAKAIVSRNGKAKPLSFFFS